ncbi:MAG: sialidase family protein [Limisphaerales bacterium]
MDLDHWRLRNQQPLDGYFTSVTYGNGRYVAVGEPGTVAVSFDGLHWTVRNYAFPSGEFSQVVFGNGTFAALVPTRVPYWSLKAVIWTSIDGLTWNTYAEPATNRTQGIAFGNGTFVKIGLGGTTSISADAIHWSPPVLVAANGLSSVYFANAVFVATNGLGLALVSADGLHWSTNQPPPLGGGNIAYSNGLYVKTVEGISRSTDGTNWYPNPLLSRTDPYRGVTYDPYWGVTFQNGFFVAVGGTLHGAASFYAGGQGYSFLSCSVMTSTDGYNWRPAVLRGTDALFGAAYGRSIFVAVGSAGSLLTSPDGFNWTDQVPGTTNALRAAAYGGGAFVVAGDNGTIQTSVDGTNFTSQESGTTRALIGLTYGDHRFVAVGDSGTILTSVDATNWVSRSSPTTNLLNAVAYGAGRFIAVGEAGTLLASPDAADWVQIEAGTRWSFSGIAFGADRFVAVGGHGPFGHVLSSPDGTHWSVAFTDPDAPLSAITYADGVFVVAGEAGVILSSADGVNWSAHNAGTPDSLFAIASGNNTFVAVGSSGAIFQSTDPSILIRLTSSVELTFSGPLHRYFRIEYRDGFDTTNAWKMIGPNYFFNSPYTWQDSIPTGGSNRFYRVIAFP